MARTTHAFAISARNTLSLHCTEEYREGTLILRRGTPNVIPSPGAADDPHFRQRRQSCAPGSWRRMECDTSYQVKFKGQCSAYSYAAVGAGRRLIFDLQRYPNLDYFDFFMEREAQILIVTGRNQEDKIALRKLDYHPEVLGYHLVEDELYFISTCEAIAVNTHTRARIRIYGKPRFISVSQSPNRRQLRAVIDHIDCMRLDARGTGILGPRVLVVGPRCTGKTSLCHLFLNEAVQFGRTPVFVDMNVYINSNTLPGAISLLKVTGERHLTEGFPGVPRVLPFGYLNISDNRALYILLLSEARDILESMLTADVSTRYSGAIIDACEILQQFDVLYLIDLFAINTVIVTTPVSDPLYGPLMDRVPPTVNLHYLPPRRSGVVCYRNLDRSDLQWRKFLEYFYGARIFPDMWRGAILHIVPFNEVSIFSISLRPNLEINFNDVELADFIAHRLRPHPYLRQRIMAVSSAIEGDIQSATQLDEIAEAQYFVYLAGIEEPPGRFIFLSPNPQSLSGATLWVMGGFRIALMSGDH